MTKADLMEAIAKEAGITKIAADEFLRAFTDTVTAALANGEKVSLIGFGTFSVGERAARTGKNPQTGKAIKIEACKSPKFKAGVGLKEAVNKGKK